jgi:signal recognition particle subunit SRP68
LRQVLGQTQSSASKPYQKKELPDVITDSRYLHLLLFQSERAWAYAMELKRDSSGESRKHHHVVKRLRRAAQYASQLSETAEKHSTEKRAQLDVKVDRYLHRLDVKRSGKVLMMFTGVFGFDARLSSF